MNQTKINRYFANPSYFKQYRQTLENSFTFPSTYDNIDDNNHLYLDAKKINAEQKRRLQQLTDASPRGWERMNTALVAKVGDYCKICGECASWVNDTGIKQDHNKKSCPYQYYYGVKDIHKYKLLMINVDDTIEKWDNKKILNGAENLKSQTTFAESLETLLKTRDSSIALAEKQLASTFASLDKEKENTKIYKEIFSIEEIKKRKETYAMEKEQMAMMNEEMEAKELEFKEREENLIIKEKAIDEKVKDKTEEANLTILAYEKRRDKRDKQIDYYRELYQNANRNVNNIRTHLDKTIQENKVLEMRHRQDKDLMEESFRENTILEDRLDKFLLKKDKQDNYEGQTCSICIEDIKDGKGTTTECGHHFHTKCYTSFMKNEFKSKAYGAVKCPNCRSHIANIT